MAELPDITPNYCTDLCEFSDISLLFTSIAFNMELCNFNTVKPMVSGPLPPYMESRARQVSAYAADGRKTQMVGYIGQIGLVFGCECLPSYVYRPS